MHSHLIARATLLLCAVGAMLVVTGCEPVEPVTRDPIEPVTRDPIAPALETGSVVFWTDATHGWSEIDITLGGSGIGSLTRYLDELPATCSPRMGSRVVASMFPGTYPYKAVTNTGISWDGTVTIEAGICLRLQLGCGADRRCGDAVECTTDSDGFNTCATAAFSNLAAQTGGSWFRARNAREMPAAILSAIDEAVDTGGASFDLMFIIDNTGSMSDDISSVKRQASHIIDRIRHLGDATVRVGLALYSDLCVDPSGWLKFQDLTTDLDMIQRQILAIGVAGGGDIPESVYDALDTVLPDSQLEPSGSLWPPDRRRTTT